MASSHTRFSLIDWLRAFAILLMFIYHFSFDLMSLQLITSETFNGILMTAIGRTCLAIFMFCVGYSLAMSHQHGMQWKKFWLRWLKIAAAATLVSLGTYIAYPSAWIYFGILHSIALASLVLIPFLFIPTIALIVGLSMGIIYAIYGVTLPFIIPFADFLHFNRSSLDYIPIFPWMWSAFVGVGMFQFSLHKKIQPPNLYAAQKISEYSLIIYLIHQPVLMAIAYGIKLAMT
jgi:uncharacterized membrane protein